MRLDNLAQAEKRLKPTPSKNKKNLFEELLRSDLDFKTSTNNCDQRYFWHAFPAKFPAELPRLFIEGLTQPNDKILDPMAGSCTTLLEAVLKQRQAIGFDIDPLSLIVGKAKFDRFRPEIAYQVGNSLIRKAKTRFETDSFALQDELKARFDPETLEFIDYWFLKETQLELLSLLQEIEIIADDSIKRFFMLVFSGMIIAKNGGVSLARDLAHTRPHKVADKKPLSAFTEFYKRLFKNLHNLRVLPDVPVGLREANARKMPLEDEVIDLIVTSPPYANNAIDYMRAHKFSLVWFGYSISELKNLRKKYVGAETVAEISLEDLPIDSNRQVMNLKEIDEKKGRALHRYYTEMSGIMKEMYRVLKRQRACVIVVATSILGGLDVKTHLCLAEIGQQKGFELIHTGKRNIDRDRRMLPTSHQVKKSQIETRMHQEFVLGLWKP